jgi:hypothetical protein
MEGSNQRRAKAGKSLKLGAGRFPSTPCRGGLGESLSMKQGHKIISEEHVRVATVSGLPSLPWVTRLVILQP